MRLEGQKGGKASGSYKVFDGAIKTIVAQNHKTGEQFRLTNTGQELTSADRKAIAEQREENRKLNEQLRQENHDKAARKAQAIVGNLQSASADHPYLVRKGVQPFYINQTKGEENSAGRLAEKEQGLSNWNDLARSRGDAVGSIVQGAMERKDKSSAMEAA